MEAWLVEDDLRLQQALASELQQVGSRVRLVRVFGSVKATLDAAARHGAPDAVLVDLGLPDGSGSDLIAKLTADCPKLVALAFTVRFDDVAIFEALRAGAVGYLLKDSTAAEIARAIEDAIAGGSPLSPSIARRVVRRLQPQSSPVSTFGLTRRESDVLEQLCSGASYRQAAVALGMAETTVQTHVKHVYEKLGAANKADAVRIALESQLVPLRET